MNEEQTSYPFGTVVWVKMVVTEERLSGGKQEHFLRLHRPGFTGIANSVLMNQRDIARGDLRPDE